MPQMSPMNWILLFMFFSLILFLFSMMNYFTYIPKMPSNMKNKIFNKSLNWKW